MELSKICDGIPSHGQERNCPNPSFCRNITSLRVDDRIASRSSNNPLELQSKECKRQPPADNNMTPKETTPGHSGGMAMHESGNSVHMKIPSIVRRHSRDDARNAHKLNKMGKRNKAAHPRSSRRKAQKSPYREEGIVQQNTLTAESDSHFLIQSQSPSTSDKQGAHTLDILTRPASTKRAECERKKVQRVVATYGEHEFYSHSAFELLAKVYWDEGLQNEAIEILQKSVELQQLSLGYGHPLNACSFEQLAGLYLRRGEFPKAALYLTRAVTVLSKHFGEYDVRTQSMRTILADTIQKQNTVGKI